MNEPQYDETRKSQKPDNVNTVAAMKKYQSWKGKWVPCGACGHLCPDEKYGYKGIHLTCTYTKAGVRFLTLQGREKKRELQALNRVQLVEFE